jgi:hypothetical protein
MFSMSVGSRTARGFAAAALILSLTATTFAGSANAAPLADETQACKVAAHARNDAVHLLHKAAKAFEGDLKDLARDARKVQHESDKTSAVLLKDVREELDSDKAEVKDIEHDAHDAIKVAAVDVLGVACKDTEADEDDTSSTSGSVTTTTTTSTTTTAPADDTRTFDTNGLDAKYKGIVDKAIADMQVVVDRATTAVTEATAAAESKDTKDDAKVKKDLETAKAGRQEAKTAANDKSNAKSNNGKGRGRN